MDTVTGLSGLTALELGRLLAAGRTDPVAVAEYFLDRIGNVADDAIFTTVTAGRALREARASAARYREKAPLGPLDGVPVAIKDLFDIKGIVTTAGSKVLAEGIPALRDAACVANLRDAGMICLGKTNMPELAYSGLGLNPHFGTPRNPFDRECARVPGGSTSGGAVAVARGLAPCALGTDTGGSIRIPAAFNGLVGYKSSEGRIDKSGVVALSFTLDTVGPLARDVADCIALDAVLGAAPIPEMVPADLSGLTVFVPETFGFDDLEEAVKNNFARSLALLSNAGTRIEYVDIPEFNEIERIASDHGALSAAEAYFLYKEWVDSPTKAAIMDGRVLQRILSGKDMSAYDLLSLLEGRRRLIASLNEKLAADTLVAMPTSPIVAPELASLEADDTAFFAINSRVLRNTNLGNLLGLCGLALPNGTSELGLPSGIMLYASGGCDDHLLRYGLSVEKAIASQGNESASVQTERIQTEFGQE